MTATRATNDTDPAAVRSQITSDEEKLMYETTIHPVLTEKEFADGCGYIYEGIPICEDERGDHVYAWGHRKPEEFARAVTLFDNEVGGVYDSPTVATEVRHVWAVTIQPANAPDGWYVSWADATAETPDAFPMRRWSA